MSLSIIARAHSPTSDAHIHPSPHQTSLFLSSLPQDCTEDVIRTWFLSKVPSLRGEHIKSVTMVPASKCAFVNFRRREEAEEAAQRCAVKVELAGKEVRVAWGRSRPGKKVGPSAEGTAA